MQVKRASTPIQIPVPDFIPKTVMSAQNPPTMAARNSAMAVHLGVTFKRAPSVRIIADLRLRDHRPFAA